MLEIFGDIGALGGRGAIGLIGLLVVSLDICAAAAIFGRLTSSTEDGSSVGLNISFSRSSRSCPGFAVSNSSALMKR